MWATLQQSMLTLDKQVPILHLFIFTFFLFQFSSADQANVWVVRANERMLSNHSHCIWTQIRKEKKWGFLGAYQGRVEGPTPPNDWGARASGGPGLRPLWMKRKKKRKKRKKKERKECKKKISMGKMKGKKIKGLREEKNSKLQF